MDPAVNLSHYTATPLGLDPERQYVQSAMNVKPVGLWVSVDGPDDWPAWCRGEEWGVGSLAHRTPITLAADADVLVLRTKADLLAFTLKYGGQMSREFLWIDWPQVAADHDGLIIAPYIWSLRFDSRTSWYYGWDCASGCIWNLAAIEPGVSTRRKR